MTVAVSFVCTCGAHVGVQKLYTNMAATYIRVSGYRTNKKPWTKNAQYYFSDSWSNNLFSTYLWVEEVKTSLTKIRIKNFRWRHMQTTNSIANPAFPVDRAGAAGVLCTRGSGKSVCDDPADQQRRRFPARFAGRLGLETCELWDTGARFGAHADRMGPSG